MKLLILPSHRLLFYHPQMHLTLLPEFLQAQQYTTLGHAHHPHHHHHHTHTHDNNHQHKHNDHHLTAIIHYKTLNIYNSCSIRELAERVRKGDGVGDKLVPVISEVLNKKIEVLDLYHTHKDKQIFNECIISDKFGDLYKIPIPPTTTTTTKQCPPIYINSNLGIPKYIKHLTTPTPSSENTPKQYILLGDEQNRIKIYNCLNPHQLLSVWFMINMTSIQCRVLPWVGEEKEDKGEDMVVLLVRWENKVTLESSIRLHYFLANQNNIHSEQYPGKQCQSTLTITQTQPCKYFTLLQPTLNKKPSILLLYLFDTKILYEVFTRSSCQLKSVFIGQLQIQQGKWDYLAGVDTGEDGTVVLAYGCDVDMPVGIEVGKEGKEGMGKEGSFWMEGDRVSLNKYEKLVKLKLDVKF